MSSNLPANVTAMKTAIAASVTAAGASTGNDFFAGMDRYGTHYYGADRTEVEPEDIWAANVLAFEHGFTCWGTEAHGTKGQNVGEVMVPIAQPMPLESDLPVQIVQIVACSAPVFGHYLVTGTVKADGVAKRNMDVQRQRSTLLVAAQNVPEVSVLAKVVAKL